MPESLWESNVEEAQQDQQLVEEESEARTVSLSVDDFSALEARIIRAVELVRKERLARAEAEERAAQAELQLREQAPLVESLQKEVVGLRTERDYVRQRVDRLLAPFDALEV
jgi:protein subunit release factor A